MAQKLVSKREFWMNAAGRTCCLVLDGNRQAYFPPPELKNREWAETPGEPSRHQITPQLESIHSKYPWKQKCSSRRSELRTAPSFPVFGFRISRGEKGRGFSFRLPLSFGFCQTEVSVYPTDQLTECLKNM